LKSSTEPLGRPTKARGAGREVIACGSFQKDGKGSLNYRRFLYRSPQEFGGRQHIVMPIIDQGLTYRRIEDSLLICCKEIGAGSRQRAAFRSTGPGGGVRLGAGEVRFPAWYMLTRWRTSESCGLRRTAQPRLWTLKLRVGQALRGWVRNITNRLAIRKRAAQAPRFQFSTNCRRIVTKRSSRTADVPGGWGSINRSIAAYIYKAERDRLIRRWVSGGGT